MVAIGNVDTQKTCITSLRAWHSVRNRADGYVPVRLATEVAKPCRSPRRGPSRDVQEATAAFADVSNQKSDVSGPRHRGNVSTVDD